MPQLLPTVDELRNMTPRQREKAAKVIRGILDETDAFIAEHLPGITLTPQQRDRARRAIWSVMQVSKIDPLDAAGQRIVELECERHATRGRSPGVPDYAVDTPVLVAARRQALLEAVQ